MKTWRSTGRSLRTLFDAEEELENEEIAAQCERPDVNSLGSVLEAAQRAALAEDANDENRTVLAWQIGCLAEDGQAQLVIQYAGPAVLILYVLDSRRNHKPTLRECAKTLATLSRDPNCASRLLEFDNFLNALFTLVSACSWRTYTAALQVVRNLVDLKDENVSLDIVKAGFVPMALDYSDNFDFERHPNDRLACLHSTSILFNLTRSDVVCQQMMKADVYNDFVTCSQRLLSAQDSTVLALGIRCIGNAMRVPEGLERIESRTEHPDGVHTIKHMLSLAHLSSENYGADVNLAMMEMAIDAGAVAWAREALVKHNAYQALIHIFLSVSSACDAVHNVQTDNAQGLSRLSPDFCAHAITAIHGSTFATRWEQGIEEPTLADAGAAMLIRMLEKQVPDIEPATCFYLGTLADDPTAFQMMSSQHSIGLIVDVIHRDRETILAESSSEDDFNVRMLIAEQTGGTRHALHTLAIITSSSDSAALSCLECDSLIPLLNVGAECRTEHVLEDVCVVYAAMCGDLPSNEPASGRHSLVSLGGLSIFPRLLATCGDGARRGAAATLAEISATVELNLPILEAELILPLAVLVCGADEDTRHYAQEAMLNFMLAGGHEALPDLVGEDMNVAESLTKAFAELVKDDAARPVLRQDGALWVLCFMATSINATDRELVASILADMAEGDVDERTSRTVETPAKLQIAKGGGMHALLTLNSNSQEIGVKQGIARALRNLCGDASVREAVTGYGGISLFVDFALSNDVELQTYSVEAISLLAHEESKCMDIIQSGGLRALLIVCTSQDLEAQMLAVQALLRLSQNDLCQPRYAEEAAADVIGLMKPAKATSVRVDATKALRNLALNLLAHDTLLKNDIVDQVSSQLKDKESVPLHPFAVAVLANLATGEEGREAVMKMEGLHEMLSDWLSLTPEENDLRVNACSFIFNCAMESRFASDFIMRLHLGQVVNVCRASLHDGGSRESFQAALALCRLVTVEDHDSDVFESLVTDDFDLFLQLLEDSEAHIYLSSMMRILAESEHEFYACALGGDSHLGMTMLQTLRRRSTDSEVLTDVTVAEMRINAARRKAGVSDMNVGDALENPSALADLEEQCRMVVEQSKSGVVQQVLEASRQLCEIAARRAAPTMLVKWGGVPACCRLARSTNLETRMNATFVLSMLSKHMLVQQQLYKPGLMGQLATACDEAGTHQVLMYVATVIVNIQAEKHFDGPVMVREGILMAMYNIVVMPRQSTAVTRQAAKALSQLMAQEGADSSLAQDEHPWGDMIMMAPNAAALLTALIGNRDSKVRLFVMRTVCELIESDSALSAFFHENAVMFLAQAAKLAMQAREPDKQAFFVAAACLVKLSNLSPAQHQLLVSDGLPILDKLGSDSDEARQEAASYGVSQLCLLDENRDMLVERGGIPVIMRLLKSSCASATARCAKALADLTMADSTHDHVLDTGLPLVLELLNRPDLTSVRFGARIISNLSRSPRGRADLGREASLTRLMALSVHSDLEVQRFMFLALAQLMTDFTLQDTLLELLGTQAGAETDETEHGFRWLLMTCGTSDDIFTVRAGMLMLFHISSNPDFIDLFEECEKYDCVKLLCESLERYSDETQRGDEDACRCALRTLVNVLPTPEKQLACAKNHLLIERLVGLLTHAASVKVLSAAYLTLANVCMPPELQLAVKELPDRQGHTALKVVAAGLQHNALPVRISCANCLATLGEHEQLRRLLVEGNMLKALLRLAAKDNRGAQLQACRALAVLGLDDSVREHLARDKGRKVLVKLCNSSDDEVRNVAIKAVGAFAEATGYEVCLLRDEIEAGRNPEEALAQHYGEVELQRRAATKLARLASTPDRHAQLVSMGGVRELISLAFASDEHVQRRVAMAFADLASNERYRMNIVLEGALFPLIETLMRSAVGAVRDDTARCLQNLAVAERPQVHELRVSEPVIEHTDVYPTGVFMGGRPGDSVYTWSRLVPVGTAKTVPGIIKNEGPTERYVEGNQKWDLAVIGRDRMYQPSVHDVGARLHFTWVPVSTTGMRGEAQELVTRLPVEASPPTITNVKVRRERPNEALLVGSGKYHGGEEGESVYVWRRLSPTGRIDIIRDAQAITCYPNTS